MHALIPLKTRWVGQISINAAHDRDLLSLMAASGCQGVLIGFESLDSQNLAKMNKGFNMTKGGFEQALANLRRHRIRLYVTFVFGYDQDTEASFEETLRFTIKHGFYLAAFNHLTPFPGTRLYHRLEGEGRILHRDWSRYDGQSVVFRPAHLSPEELYEGFRKVLGEVYSFETIARKLASFWERDF